MIALLLATALAAEPTIPPGTLFGATKAPGPIAQPAQPGAEPNTRPNRVRVSPPTVTGDVDAEDAAGAARFWDEAAERCVKAGSTANGTVRLYATITEKGRLTGIEVREDALHDDTVLACIRSVLADAILVRPTPGEALDSLDVTFEVVSR